MIAPTCSHENRAKKGKDRQGNQRYRCRDCGVSFSSEAKRPLGDMRITLDQASLVLGMLLEGMSIRACERLTGLKRDTICDLVLVAGENCDRFLGAIKGVETRFCEMDEVWGFVGLKNRTKEARGYTDPDLGDAWTWLAIDADSKMIVSHATGQRDERTCVRFLRRLNRTTSGRIQVTSDGYRCYQNNVPFELGSRVDFAQLIKSYSSSQSETRYSPATITGIEKVARFGNPDMDRCSTSYSERLNLSVRMHVRRFTRLTNAHSKSARHHAAMMSLFAGFYNFCRKHETVKMTPAMASGVADKVWTIKELLKAAANGGAA